MKKNIWESYDFESIKNKVPVMDSETLGINYVDLKDINPNQKYIDIIDELSMKIIGEQLVNAQTNDDFTRIHVNVKAKETCHYSVYTFYTENDGSYLIDGMKFDDLDFFKKFATQIIEIKCKDKIRELYKHGIIANIPFENKPNNVDLNKITKKWFKEEFERIAEEEGNGETLEKVKIKNENNLLTITFDVDCGRAGLHRGGNITITERGVVRTHLPEIIEGSGIDNELKRNIEKLIK